MDETITYACIDVMPSGRNIAPLVDTVVNLLEYGNFLFALVTNAARVEDFFRKLSEGNSMGRDIIRPVEQTDKTIFETDLNNIVSFDG